MTITYECNNDRNNLDNAKDITHWKQIRQGCGDLRYHTSVDESSLIPYFILFDELNFVITIYSTDKLLL